MSLDIAVNLDFEGDGSNPDLFRPYGGFRDGVRVEGGHIMMMYLANIGFEGKRDLCAEMKALPD